MELLKMQIGTEKERTTHVKFYKKAVKNNFKSAQENKNVFDEKEYIKIIIPGDNKTLIDRRVTDKDRNVDYPNLYQNYKKREKDLEVGTPLAMLPTLRDIDVQKLQALNVHTLEHLVNLGEAAIKKVEGCRQMMRDAEKFLSTDDLVKKLEKENLELKDKIKELENELANNNSGGSAGDRASGQSDHGNGQSKPSGTKKPKPAK